MFSNNGVIDCSGIPNRCWKCRVVIAVGAFCDDCSAEIEARRVQRSLAPVVVVEADADDDGYEIELTREEREARLDAWWGKDEDVPQSLSPLVYRWWW